jgi:hypothetical protein
MLDRSPTSECWSRVVWIWLFGLCVPDKDSAFAAARAPGLWLSPGCKAPASLWGVTFGCPPLSLSQALLARL